MKDKIVIGSHTLDSYGVGKTFENRYIDMNSGRFDGIHLFGPTGQMDFTKSIIKIIHTNFPELSRSTGPKTKLGNKPDVAVQSVVEQMPWKEVIRKKSGAKIHQSNQISGFVQTQNRFQPFSQGNSMLGNY